MELFQEDFIVTRETKNILLLRIYSENQDKYVKMKSIHDKYTTNRICPDNIDVFYVLSDNTINEDIKLEGNIVKVKGNEGILNILGKTIKALEFLCKYKDYDYIVRSNISTFIHYKKLVEYIDTLPTTNVYTSGIISLIKWKHKSYGVLDKHKNTFSGSGTGIIMSADVLRDLLSNKEKLDYSVVDDVAIGVYMSEYNTKAYHYLIVNYVDLLTQGKTFTWGDNYKACKNHSLIIRKVHPIKDIMSNIFIRIKESPEVDKAKLIHYYTQINPTG